LKRVVIKEQELRSVTVGTLAPSAAASAALATHLRLSELTTLVTEATEYCRSKSDRSARPLLQHRPDVILIDGEDIAAALTSIQVLHSAIPSAWILVCTPAADTETILKIIRAGAREVIPMPMTQESLSQALHRHIEERDREQKNNSNANGKIFAICSAKRGCGATTLAINLAASLSENSSRHVALLDLDWPLGDAAAFLNIKPQFTVADALASVGRLDSVLLESYMHKHDRFHVLAGLEDFSGSDGFDPTTVSQLLEVITQTYTHAVVDLPLSFSRQLFLTVIGMSSAVVTVVTADVLSVRRTERLLRAFESFDVSDKVRLVLNRSSKSDEITETDIEKALRQPVALKLANDYYACIEAMNSGKAVLATSSKNLSRDYRELAERLLGPNQEKPKGLARLLPRTSLSTS
jgi:pilus assembly protein CpaE